MSSAFSLHSNFSDEELPSYEEVSLPPNVTIEEREISSDDEDDYDDEQSEQKSTTTKQSTKTFASVKAFLSGSTPPLDVQKSTITFDKVVVPMPVKSDRKPSFKREFSASKPLLLQPVLIPSQLLPSKRLPCNRAEMPCAHHHCE